VKIPESCSGEQEQDGANRNKGHMAKMRWVLVAVGLTVATAACGSGSGKTGGAQAGKVDPGPDSSAGVAESTTTTVAVTRESLVLSADGLGPVQFGMQAARALAGLTQALGQAAPPKPVTDAACGATRTFHWGDLTVVANEVSGRAGTTPGFVGWSLAGPAPDTATLRTDKGIGLGSTLKALRAAYGSAVAVTPGRHGPGFTITTPSGSMTGTLDAVGDAGKVTTLQAGTVCS
jgi:hypothetical protein